MKYLITTVVCLILLSSSLKAQVAGATFYGSDAMQYKGKTLKVISTPLPYFYYLLSKDIPWNEKGNQYLPTTNRGESDAGKLFNKEFIVVDVVNHPKEEGVFFLELKEKASGEQVYYYYDPSAKNYFAMKVIDPLTNEESEDVVVDYCSQIEVERDKFTSQVTYRSPSRSFYTIRVYKDVSKQKIITYTLGLFTTSDEAVASAKGVTILLNNKAKIVKPAVNVNVDVRKYQTHGNNDFEYSAYVTLTSSDRSLLLKHRITDFRLYIADQEVIESEGDTLQEHLRCMTTNK